MKKHCDYLIDRRVNAENKLDKLRELKLPIQLMFEDVGTIQNKGLTRQ